MAEVMLHSSFNPAEIKFAPISKTSKGGKIVYLALPADKRIKVQTPVLSAPFGVSSFEDAAAVTQSYSIDASFRGFETDPKIAGFLTKCRAFDEHLLQAAADKSKEWLGKAMTKELAAEFFRKTVREANDPSKYAPTMKLKIAMKDGRPSSEFYDEHQEPVGMDYIVKGTTFRAIIELSSIWFINKTFGATWRLAQLAVVSRPDRLAGFAFQPEDDEAAEEL